MSSEEIQALILRAVSAGKTRFSAIWSACGGVGRKKLDDELQKLRKAGKIEYVSKTGWRVTGK